jgi:DNA-binding response OmpR family regulator
MIEQKPAPSSSRQLRMLVVDDSDVILHALRHFFEDYNFEVITCSDGLEGLRKAVEVRPNVIFLDLMMPNFDGIKMLQVKKVLMEIKDIPVIVISANTDRRNVLAAIEAGADRVISKPLQKETIIRYVNEVLGEKLFEKDQQPDLLTEEDQAELQRDLTKVFMAVLPAKKSQLAEGLKNRDYKILKTVAHELKGSGSTIGQANISTIAAEIQRKEPVTDTDWMFVQLKCEQLFQALKRLEDEFTVTLTENGG